MSLQSKFRTFHERINLRRLAENAILREKRDAVLSRLRTEQKFETFNQGSYEMGTGVKPINGDYDIDVGVIFPVPTPGAASPVTVKRWVYAAVCAHTKQVSWKEPCITVQYQKGGEPIYHVDLAVYGRDSLGRLHLARGKEHSDNARWEVCDPKGLTTAVDNRFRREDAAQFRRVVQYLKRWKDVHFPTEGNAAPVGIGLTILAYHSFAPMKTGYPAVYDDLSATRSLISRIAAAFRSKLSVSRTAFRIEARVPTLPKDDVFARMTDEQTTQFKGRVDHLKAWLDQAASTGSAAPLRQAFGTDFPE